MYPFTPNGPFGNMMPYSDFHALNLDWVIQIARDFLDQYTHIQEQISAGEQSLDDKLAEDLASLEAKYTEIEGLLNTWYTTHSNDIQAALTQALATFATQAQELADAAIASIPEDYSTLSATVVSLKNSLEGIDCTDPTGYISGSITNGGSTSTSNTQIRSAAPIMVSQGMWLTVDDAYEVGVAIYNAKGFTTSNFWKFLAGNSSTWQSGTIIIPNTYIGKYIGVRIRKVGHTSDDISGDVSTIENYVKLFNPSTVVTSKIFPYYLEDRVKQFIPVRTPSAFWWVFGKNILANGTENNNTSAAHTEKINIKQYTTIINNSPATDADDHTFNVYVCEYVDSTFSSRTQINSGAVYTTKEDTTSIILLASYPGDESVIMTSTRLMTNFRIGFQGNPVSGDGMTASYGAIGASTTIGAVHHYSGQSVTYSPFAYPDYIGQVMGGNAINLGQGTVGFMARDNGLKPNFMDICYNNVETLKNMDLITLMFGYGNDQTAGLPFGSWDDYFPYDSVEEFFVPGETAANQAGITAMLEAGATLCGCLNWCIKFLGENCPKAILLPIFGAPSVNADYAITIIDNPDPTGTSPNKIQVADRTNSNAEQIDILRQHLNIPFINMWTDGAPFSYFASYATEADGTYSIFSTKGTPENKTWNSHPNETGYLLYARYLAGQILGRFLN